MLATRARITALPAPDSFWLGLRPTSMDRPRPRAYGPRHERDSHAEFRPVPEARRPSLPGRRLELHLPRLFPVDQPGPEIQCPLGRPALGRGAPVRDKTVP